MPPRTVETAYTGWPRRRINFWMKEISININPRAMKRK